MPNKFCSFNDACQELDISKRSLRRLIARKELRAVRIGNTSIVRIDRESLNKLIRSYYDDEKN